MATDATGTPSSLGIPKYNTAADAPSGKGLNAIIDSINTLLVARATLATPTFTGTVTLPNTITLASGSVFTWNGDANLYRASSVFLRTDGGISGNAASTAAGSFEAITSGDTQSRLFIKGDGSLNWSAGSGSLDTSLSRTGVALLNTPGKLTATAGLGVGNSASATVAVGTLAKKIEVFDAAGSSLGYIPVYSSIT